MRWTMALGAALGLAAAGVAEARTAPRLEGVPRFAHVFVIIEENKDYDQIVGGENAPIISHLAREYGDASASTGKFTRARRTMSRSWPVTRSASMTMIPITASPARPTRLRGRGRPRLCRPYGSRPRPRRPAGRPPPLLEGLLREPALTRLTRLSPATPRSATALGRPPCTRPSTRASSISPRCSPIPTGPSAWLASTSSTRISRPESCRISL